MLWKLLLLRMQEPPGVQTLSAEWRDMQLRHSLILALLCGALRCGKEGHAPVAELPATRAPRTAGRQPRATRMLL